MFNLLKRPEQKKIEKNSFLNILNNISGELSGVDIDPLADVTVMIQQKLKNGKEIRKIFHKSFPYTNLGVGNILGIYNNKFLKVFKKIVIEEQDKNAPNLKLKVKIRPLFVENKTATNPISFNEEEFKDIENSLLSDGWNYYC